MTTIAIPHLYRVEGHGGIRVEVGPDGATQVQSDIFEGSRFFEVLLVGQPVEAVPGIVSRVCSICSAAHTLTSVAALEDALGIEVDTEVQALRDLLNVGETIESHALHLFALAAPDAVGATGILAMAQTHHDAVVKGLNIKRVGNLIQERIGGRAIHPMNITVGGAGLFPDREVLTALTSEVAQAREDADALLGLVETLIEATPQPGPKLWVALEPEGAGYGLRGKRLLATGFEPVGLADFRSRVHEHVVGHSTAKQSLYAKQPFMVGAAARCFHSGARLDGAAGALWRRWQPMWEQAGSGANHAGQYIELVWALERALTLIEQIALHAGRRPDPVLRTRPSGQGVAALEVPRGTLFHAYTVENGVVTDCDIVTPTAQNLASLEQDIERLTGRWWGGAGAGGTGDQAPLRRELEMLARAYDPCISCATHLIDLRVRHEG
ncbi:MAG: hypothetical protein AUJ55_02055 [Proteobacteria bacterium CG1_02_64_396]|nr:MAG: hypothetical protein AUJ55_02055 [Proteobacteria bacterium CG1_02_64_396]